MKYLWIIVDWLNVFWYIILYIFFRVLVFGVWGIELDWVFLEYEVIERLKLKWY